MFKITKMQVFIILALLALATLALGIITLVFSQYVAGQCVQTVTTTDMCQLYVTLFR